MFGWRGKIGKITPAGDFILGPEYDSVLPEGVAMTVTTLGVERLAREDIEKAFNMYPAAANHLATQECDVIVAVGSLVFSFVGWDRARQMIQKIRDTIGTPIITDLDAHFDGLRALSAKKIVIATPYEEGRNQERKRLCESVGFEVLNIKGLGVQRRLDLGRLPPYASYRLAKQAYLEAPEADAIYISCPEWPTVHNIEKLEQDTGKPVVSAVTGFVWGALRAMHFKAPIRGYGRLLEML
jgi:maleate cis-trans isomerase